MAESVQATYRSLLEAVSFGARAHEHQRRKDGRTPYASHPFRVCLILRHVFGLDDAQALTAAALHDTLEDTTTDFDDLEEHFGREVAEWVAALSKDKRLPETQREQVYLAQLVRAPWQVKVCKLADLFDNGMDLCQLRPAKAERSLGGSELSRRNTSALASGLPLESVTVPANVVPGSMTIAALPAKRSVLEISCGLAGKASEA